MTHITLITHVRVDLVLFVQVREIGLVFILFGMIKLFAHYWEEQLS